MSDIFRSLGISGKCGGGCPEWIAKMNAWGPSGCREHREEILEHLRTAYDQASLATKARAGMNAVAQGLPLTLEGLLDEAIRRATAPDSGS